MMFLDRMVATGMRIALDQMFADVGRMETLRLDTSKKTVAGSVMLKGETDAVEFQVGHYELMREGEHVRLTLREVTCSREWMQRLVERMGPEFTVKLPDRIAQAVVLARMV